MANLIDAVTFCEWSDCQKRSTHRVYNDLHKYVGSYCAKHAEKKVAEVSKAERTPKRQQGIVLR